MDKFEKLREEFQLLESEIHELIREIVEIESSRNKLINELNNLRRKLRKDSRSNRTQSL